MRSSFSLVVVCTLFPFVVFAEVCREGDISRPDMVGCMLNDLSKNEKYLQGLLDAKSAEYEISEDFYKSQRDGLHSRCMLYSGLGGQRAEILEVQCEIDGVKELLNFVERYMQAVDVN